MADSCIICMEELEAVPDLQVAAVVAGPSTPETIDPGDNHDHQAIALIKPCGHILHDECLRLWAQKANSCPICRHIFNHVEVLDKIGGALLSEYEVENKKQIAEFDPAAWIDENPEEDEDDGIVCLVCDTSTCPEVLLVCEGCESPYHTHCLEMDGLPSGHSWFCMACEDDGVARSMPPSQRRAFSNQPRTRATIQQARLRMRQDNWVGAWGQFSNQVHNAVGLDLDFSDDEQNMSSYRRHQARTASERLEFEQWQRRLNIASRQGAGSIFRVSAPVLRDQRSPVNSPPAETVDESIAWGNLEKAKELDNKPASTSRGRKRKSRSVTDSPSSPATGPSLEPERKLKRPRTRRVVDPQVIASSSRQSETNGSPTIHSGNPLRPSIDTSGEPSFLSSLLKEVETATSDYDDDLPSRSNFDVTSPPPNRVTSPFTEHSSPAASPSPPSSRQHSPRPMSTTPPPRCERRPGSPLPLTSRVGPRQSNSDYSPNRPASDPNERSVQNGTLELRQPRPQRPDPTQSRSPAISPARANMSTEAKEGINRIVKDALKPHWKASEMTENQYADINRYVSRKLYEIVTESNASEDQDRFTWEKIAREEVGAAIKSLNT